jgi:hypothetical protein
LHEAREAFAHFFVNALDRKSAAHGLGFVDGYKRALWKQRQYRVRGKPDAWLDTSPST